MQQSMAGALVREIDELVFALNRRLSAFREAQFATLDLTVPQSLVLQHLQVPAPMNEIADRLGCKASNITGIVDRLEARGAVERRIPQGDRRVKQIALTPEGEVLRQHVEALISSPFAPGMLPQQDLVQLRDLLCRFLGQVPYMEPTGVHVPGEE